MKRPYTDPGKQRGGVAKPASAAATIGGLNSRDPLSTMSPTDAVTLTNLYSKGGEVKLRSGYTEYATLDAAGSPAVQSLFVYANKGGSRRLFAVPSTNGLFEVTGGGTLRTKVADLSGGPFNAVNFTNSVGTAFFWGCNGIDPPLAYDGATYYIIDVGQTVELTGVNPRLLVNPWVFKRRIYTIEQGTMNVWYLPSDSIGGAAVKMPLGGLFTRGGHLVAGARWTVDAGAGPDDYFVIITSNGEVGVYQGTDPSSILTWALVGVYYVGDPLNDQCFFPLGGDLGVITRQGVFLLSQALPSNATIYSKALSDKITPTLQALFARFGSYPGWDAVVYPRESALVLNIPTGAGTSEQYVCNLELRSWSRFTGFGALCWVLFDDSLYFGGHDGKVYRAWSEHDLSDAGGYITGVAQTAFNYFGVGVGNKRVGLFRPTVFYTGATEIKWGWTTDFESGVLTDTQAELAPSGSTTWDAGTWDEASWDNAEVLDRRWKAVPADVGYAHALLLQVKTKTGTVRWTGIDYLLTQGGLM